MSAQLVVALTLAILDLTSTRPPDVSERHQLILYAHSRPLRWKWSSKWAKLIDKVAREEKEDPFLVAAIVSKESGFNPGKINPSSGAAGLLQVMPGSADHVLLGWQQARKKSVPIERILVPATNLKVGIRILKRYKLLCEGDLVRALSAFSGQGCVDSEYGRDVERRWMRARAFYEPVG